MLSVLSVGLKPPHLPGVFVSACSGSYRDNPAGPTAGLAEPVPRDGMPAVSGAAGGRGFVRGLGAGRAGGAP